MSTPCILGKVRDQVLNLENTPILMGLVEDKVLLKVTNWFLEVR